MRKLFLLFGVISTIFLSCENNQFEKLFNDKVFFLRNGQVQVTGFLSNDKIDIDIPLYRSGIAENAVSVSIEIDPSILSEYKNSDGEAFQVLPKENYTLSADEAVFEGDTRSQVLKLSIDIKKLGVLEGILDDKFALPLIVRTNGISITDDSDKLVVVPVLTGGIRPGSAEVLWSKTFTQLGINATNHFTASLGVTSKYVFVNTRAEDLRYYDRFTGDYVGTIPLSFKGSLTNFTVTNDDHDNLLVTNLRNAAGQALQTIYKISNGGTPTKFIESTHIYPNGRKMSVVGDLNGKAIITSAMENSSNVLIWKVENGIVKSHTPEVLTLDATKILWGSFGDAIPKSMDLNDGLFAVGAGTLPNFGYFGSNGELIGALNLTQFGMPTANTITAQSLAKVEFNGAKYLTLAIQSGQLSMYSLVLDVTKTKGMGVIPASSFITYTSPAMATTANANVTADIQARVSDDKKSFIMYSLGTNGSIIATKFSD